MNKLKKLSPRQEDYLKAVCLITRKQGKARSKEIMRLLGVSGPSVTEALQSLTRKGMVNYQPYENITITPEGEKVAEGLLHRHETLRDFFIEVLGIDRETADKGACKMEHAASPNIIKRMIMYTDYLKNECKISGGSKVHCFAEYLRDLEKEPVTTK